MPKTRKRFRKQTRKRFRKPIRKPIRKRFRKRRTIRNLAGDANQDPQPMEIDDDDVNPNPWIPMPIGGPLADPGWEAREREIDRERGRRRERERGREIREIRDRIMRRGEWREAEEMEPQQLIGLGNRLQRLVEQTNNYNEYLNLNNNNNH